MKFKGIFSLILLTVSPLLFSIELIDGVKQEFGMTFTDQQRSALPVFSGVVKKNTNKFYDLFSLAFINIEDTNNWYRLYDDLNIYGVNVETKQYLGNWPLTTPYSCDDGGDDCELNWWVGRWSDQEFLEPQLKNLFRHHSGDEIGIMGDGLGCLGKTPLRYGDIDEDKKNELVLFLNDKLLIFSPEKQKTVFLMLYNLDDFTSVEDTITQHGFEKPEFPQYVSKIKTNSGAAFKVSSQVTEPALQAFAKLYTIDVNDDQVHDLIVWRKLYQSRLQSDADKGFEKLSDSYLHYKKVNGEYQLQTDTAPETIQGWLTAKNLTWQKGFPSKSECAGQEGQLITEMHDPLLNDPDVLK